MELRENARFRVTHSEAHNLRMTSRLISKLDRVYIDYTPTITSPEFDTLTTEQLPELATHTLAAMDYSPSKINKQMKMKE